MKIDRYCEHFELLGKSKTISEYLGGVLTIVGCPIESVSSSIEEKINTESSSVINSSDREVLTRVNSQLEKRIDLLKERCWVRRYDLVQELLQSEIRE